MSERQWVTIGLFGFALILLLMSMWQPALWEVDVYKSILQAVVITGILNMVAAFHFAANASSQEATKNTGAAFRAITATAEAGAGAMPHAAVTDAADEVADAAVDAADIIRGDV